MNPVTAYVVNQGPDSVTPIQIPARRAPTPLSGIQAGLSPGAIAITPDGAFAYAANLEDNSVSVIETASNTVVDMITTVDIQQPIAITP